MFVFKNKSGGPKDILNTFYSNELNFFIILIKQGLILMSYIVNLNMLGYLSLKRSSNFIAGYLNRFKYIESYWGQTIHMHSSWI